MLSGYLSGQSKQRIANQLIHTKQGEHMAGQHRALDKNKRKRRDRKLGIGFRPI